MANLGRKLLLEDGVCSAGLQLARTRIRGFHVTISTCRMQSFRSEFFNRSTTSSDLSSRAIERTSETTVGSYVLR
jgi:hypothetical protein